MTGLELAFERLAFTTWDTIGKAFSEHIAFGEDAITSVNLLSLKNERSEHLAICDTRAQESVKGCDFEFWVGNDVEGWHRYAIQAKKLRVQTERYDSLAHEVSQTPQIDILENYASANRAVPLYCFFNHSHQYSTQGSKCPKFRNTKELGCSITPSATVRVALNTRGARKFSWMHEREETLPWSCLVRCPQIENHWPHSVLGRSLSELTYQQLPQALRLFTNNEYPAEDFLTSGVFSEEVIHRPAFVGVFNVTKG